MIFKQVVVSFIKKKVFYQVIYLLNYESFIKWNNIQQSKRMGRYIYAEYIHTTMLF